MDLSIVIPVYNEEQKIRHDIVAATAFLSEQGMRGEIIVVDDGSDDRTSDVAKETAVDEEVSLKVIGYEKHSGKGRAVKTGIMEAGADLVMFIDSGNCVPYEDVIRGMDLIKNNKCQIAHGSRFLDGSIITRTRKPHRRLASFLFRRSIHLLSRIPEDLTDTQCGLKIYRKGIAHELFAACRTDGFLFDIEIILRAREKGYRIMEFPIVWTSDPDSRLSPGTSFPEIMAEWWMIRKTLNPSRQES